MNLIEHEMEVTMKGTVKFYDPVKGYGFILGEDGNDYFVHRYEIVTQIDKGDAVKFTKTKTERGLQADRVELQ